MPPEPMEYVGRPEIHRFLSTVPARGELQRFRLGPDPCKRPARVRLLPANARASVGRAYGLMVLTLGQAIVAITGFPDTSVFDRFGLPRTLSERPSGGEPSINASRAMRSAPNLRRAGPGMRPQHIPHLAWRGEARSEP